MAARRSGPCRRGMVQSWEPPSLIRISQLLAVMSPPRHSFGAQFAEVRINADTGEIHVSRMLGVFSVGRIINPVTARSQFIGGMTMGIGMALHERGVMDPRFGIIVNHDFADYHIPTAQTSRTSPRSGSRNLKHLQA
jgi:CO/xanthine dehydrogenase Mo-binding subunit